MEDEQNYRLIGGDESKNNEEPTDKETAYLLNDCSRINSTNEVNNTRRINRNNNSGSDLVNNIVNSFDNNNTLSKFILGAFLFHPIINLIIQDNPTVKKMFTKAQRKMIKRILIVFMLFCLIGFSTSNTRSCSGLMSFFLKFLLITFLLIHTNLFNVTNFNETIKLWKKVLNKKHE